LIGLDKQVGFDLGQTEGTLTGKRGTGNNEGWTNLKRRNPGEVARVLALAVNQVADGLY
jgi:hypothetical protein